MKKTIALLAAAGCAAYLFSRKNKPAAQSGTTTGNSPQPGTGSQQTGSQQPATGQGGTGTTPGNSNVGTTPEADTVPYQTIMDFKVGENVKYNGKTYRVESKQYPYFNIMSFAPKQVLTVHGSMLSR